MKKIDMYRAGLQDRYINPFVVIEDDDNYSDIISNNANFGDMITPLTVKEFMNDMIDREDAISSFINVSDYTDNDFKDMIEKISADDELFSYIFESIDDSIVNNVLIKTYKKLFNIDLAKCGLYGDYRLTQFLLLPDREKYEKELKDICGSIIDDREHWLDSRRAISNFLNDVLYGNK